MSTETPPFTVDSRQRGWRPQLLLALLERACWLQGVERMHYRHCLARRRDRYHGASSVRVPHVRVWMHRRFESPGRWPKAFIDSRLPELEPMLRRHPLRSRLELLIWLLNHEVAHWRYREKSGCRPVHPNRIGRQLFTRIEELCDCAGLMAVDDWRAGGRAAVMRRYRELLEETREQGRARRIERMAAKEQERAQQLRDVGGLAGMMERMRRMREEM